MEDIAQIERRVQNAVSEMRAELIGLQSQINTIDERWAEWRKSTFSAFALMAQRDTADHRERQRRQKVLNRAMVVLGVGLIVVIVLLGVLVALVAGYIVGQTSAQHAQIYL